MSFQGTLQATKLFTLCAFIKILYVFKFTLLVSFILMLHIEILIVVF